MPFWLLKRIDPAYYDEYAGKVVEAETEMAARNLANQDTGDEGKLWTDEHAATCERLEETGRERVILDDFNAG